MTSVQVGALVAIPNGFTSVGVTAADLKWMEHVTLAAYGSCRARSELAIMLRTSQKYGICSSC